MLMKIIKGLSLSVAVILLALLVSEGVVRLISPVKPGERVHFIENAWSWPTTDIDKFDGPLMSGHVAHPFWGFHLNPKIAGINKMGFRDPNEFPYQRQDNEIVIAFLGGSVAEGNYKFLVPELQKALRSCERPIKVLNFAQGAHKQPSQFHIYSYFLETFDLSINIDGLNDALFFPSAGYPSAYPVFTNSLFYLDTNRLNLMNKAFFYAKLQYRVAKAYRQNQNFLHSDLAFIIAQKIFYAAENKKQKLMDEASHPSFNIEEPNHDLLKRLDEQIAIWEKYTTLQHTLSQLHNKKSFFFLQPSQYIKNGKILTQEEKKIALLKDPKELNRYTEAYVKLPVSTKNLRDQHGIDITDLSSLFTKNTESIFTDDCCHINDRGNTLLAQAMAQKVAPFVLQRLCKNQHNIQ